MAVLQACYPFRACWGRQSAFASGLRLVRLIDGVKSGAPANLSSFVFAGAIFAHTGSVGC